MKTEFCCCPLFVRQRRLKVRCQRKYMLMRLYHQLSTESNAISFQFFRGIHWMENVLLFPLEEILTLLMSIWTSHAFQVAANLEEQQNAFDLKRCHKEIFSAMYDLTNPSMSSVMAWVAFLHLSFDTYECNLSVSYDSEEVLYKYITLHIHCKLLAENMGSEPVNRYRDILWLIKYSDYCGGWAKLIF